MITDLGLAPRNAAGKVEYAADFVLLKPMDMARASGILRYVAPNRGGAAIAADPYFLARGEVFLWGAWQGDVPRGPGRLALDVPVARNPDGSPITGTVRVEFVGRRGTRPAEMPLQGNAYNRGQVPDPPAEPRRPDGGPDPAPQRGRPPALHPPGATGRSPRATSPTTPSRGGPAPPGSRSGAASRPSPSTSWSTRPRTRRSWGWASRRSAIRSPSSATRPRTRAGHANPLGSAHPIRDRHRRLAVGQLPEDLRSPGLQRGHRRASVFDALFPIVAARQTNLNARFAVPGGGAAWRRAPGIRPELGPRIRRRLSRRDPRPHRRHLPAGRGDEDDPEDLPRA